MTSQSEWIRGQDTATGRLYFFNTRTRERRWASQQADTAPRPDNASASDPRHQLQYTRQQVRDSRPSTSSHGETGYSLGSGPGQFPGGTGTSFPEVLVQTFEQMNMASRSYPNQTPSNYQGMNYGSASMVNDGRYRASQLEGQPGGNRSGGSQEYRSAHSRSNTNETSAPTQPRVQPQAPTPQRVRRTLKTNSDSQSGLDPEFRVRKKPKDFFKVGKVFLTLYSEATTSSINSNPTEITSGTYGENVYSTIRRFVVIREGRGCCAAIPILTYTGRACGKSGVQKYDHAIIYTGAVPPAPTLAETSLRHGEYGMQRITFRVRPHNEGAKLDPLSRINLAKVYTIEHNVKVCGFGWIDNVPQLLLLQGSIWNPASSQPTTHNDNDGGEEEEVEEGEDEENEEEEEEE